MLHRRLEQATPTLTGTVGSTAGVTDCFGRCATTDLRNFGLAQGTELQYNANWLRATSLLIRWRGSNSICWNRINLVKNNRGTKTVDAD
jgi:hypothetical protein